MIIVSNTTPLHYLVLIDATEVLPALYSRVVIPEAVRAELLHPNAPDLVREWAARLPEWVEVCAVKLVDPTLDLGAGDRDRGEREAISLAMELKAGMVLLDDRKARQAAVERGLRMTGTLGVLEAAVAQGLQDPSIIARLERHTNFRATPETFQASRERVQELRTQQD